MNLETLREIELAELENETKKVTLVNFTPCNNALIQLGELWQAGGLETYDNIHEMSWAHSGNDLDPVFKLIDETILFKLLWNMNKMKLCYLSLPGGDQGA